MASPGVASHIRLQGVSGTRVGCGANRMCRVVLASPKYRNSHGVFAPVPKHRSFPVVLAFVEAQTYRGVLANVNGVSLSL